VTQIATMIKVIDNRDQRLNPNVVKVVANKNGEGLYFSRATIPHIRNTNENEWLSKHKFFKHIGMYAYRSDILAALTRLPVSALERAESLEQLRWLENGFS